MVAKMKREERVKLYFRVPVTRGEALPELDVRGRRRKRRSILRLNEQIEQFLDRRLGKQVD